MLRRKEKHFPNIRNKIKRVSEKHLINGTGGFALLLGGGTPNKKLLTLHCHGQVLSFISKQQHPTVVIRKIGKCELD